jgi:hypothetical protein
VQEIVDVNNHDLPMQEGHSRVTTRPSAKFRLQNQGLMTTPFMWNATAQIGRIGGKAASIEVGVLWPGHGRAGPAGCCGESAWSAAVPMVAAPAETAPPTGRRPLVGGLLGPGR